MAVNPETLVDENNSSAEGNAPPAKTAGATDGEASGSTGESAPPAEHASGGDEGNGDSASADSDSNNAHGTADGTESKETES